MNEERVKRPSMGTSPKVEMFPSPSEWEPRSYGCASSKHGGGYDGCEGLITYTRLAVSLESPIDCECWCHREEALQEALEAYSLKISAPNNHKHKFGAPNDSVLYLPIFLTCVTCQGLFAWPDGMYTRGDGLWGAENDAKG